VQAKRAEMTTKIAETYANQMHKCNKFIAGLQSLFETLDKIKKAEIRVDIDQVNLNRAVEFRINEIETEMHFQTNGNELDLINSRFINDPILKIERSLKNYDFFPVQKQVLVDLCQKFQESKILKPEHFTVDFLSEIMPTN